MKLRARLMLATAAMMLVALGLSFWAVPCVHTGAHAEVRGEAIASVLALSALGSVLLSAWVARSVDAMMSRLDQALEAQKGFVAHAAHELRTPITVVHGQLALALRRPREAHDYRDAIEEALGSAAQLRALTDELLDLARAGASRGGPRPPTSLAGAAEGAARMVRAEADRAGVALDLRLGAALVAGSATDLERMIRNLLENAVRHSPRGGRVTLEVSAGDATVELAVADQGNGVPEGERGKLFDPFFRGASERAAREGGVGLGLAIVREIARAHGGDAHLDTTAARGARFVVRLPLLGGRRGSASPANDAGWLFDASAGRAAHGARSAERTG